MLDLNGKTILVSTRKINEDGDSDIETFFGSVISFNENTVILSRPGVGEFSMPYSEEVIEPAEPGFYELEDGTTHENPEYIAQWVVYASAEARVKFGETHINVGS
jgi:hypothetical protein